MSKHTTYKGTTIDMDSMRRENEKTPAIGNMSVNAKGDKIGKHGVITKTADQLARENHRVQSTIIHSGLKGSVPTSPATLDQSKQQTPVKANVVKTETELPNGDIVVGEENED